MARIHVCRHGELAEGEHRLVDLGDGFEAAVWFVQGSYHAIEDICTHDDGPLAEGELDGWCVTCPRHGAKFDIRTGEAKALPAYRPVEAFEVVVDEDGDVWLVD